MSNAGSVTGWSLTTKYEVAKVKSITSMFGSVIHACMGALLKFGTPYRNQFLKSFRENLKNSSPESKETHPIVKATSDPQTLDKADRAIKWALKHCKTIFSCHPGSGNPTWLTKYDAICRLVSSVMGDIGDGVQNGTLRPRRFDALAAVLYRSG